MELNPNVYALVTVELCLLRPGQNLATWSCSLLLYAL